MHLIAFLNLRLGRRKGNFNGSVSRSKQKLKRCRTALYAIAEPWKRRSVNYIKKFPLGCGMVFPSSSISHLPTFELLQWQCCHLATFTYLWIAIFINLWNRSQVGRATESNYKNLWCNILWQLFRFMIFFYFFTFFYSYIFFFEAMLGNNVSSYIFRSSRI